MLVALAGATLATAFAIEESSPGVAIGSPTPDLLDVVQVGTGSAPLSNAATASFVVPLLGSGGTGTPIALPTALRANSTRSGLAARRPLGGALELSADGNYLTLAGYGATPGTTGPGGGTINGSTSAEVPRVVARI